MDREIQGVLTCLATKETTTRGHFMACLYNMGNFKDNKSNKLYFQHACNYGVIGFIKDGKGVIVNFGRPMDEDYCIEFINNFKPDNKVFMITIE